VAAPRILVVEDELPLARILGFSFENEGFVVARAEDGVECMNKVSTFQPDVIIMDLMMPKLDGLETIRLLRSSELHRDLLIVVVTARARPIDRKDAVEAGADFFVKKPFQISVLIDRVNGMLIPRGVG